MEKNNIKYKVYIDILRKELVLAKGCTEPIALAYCAAKVRSVLGQIPDRVLVEVSGNIIKNCKSVVVPNTGGLKGIETAVAIGIIAGNEKLELEVLKDISEKQITDFKNYLKENKIEIKKSDSNNLLDIKIEAYKGEDKAVVRICHKHTNIVYIQKNDEIILDKNEEEKGETNSLRYDLLTIEDIYDFAKSVDIKDIEEIIKRQIDLNTVISKDGLENSYGANIGSTLLKLYGDDIRNVAKAKAAAGSDARMNGSEYPVVVNSGSGNQGLTVSIPVIEYAKKFDIDDDTLYRALVVSNLCAIHQKSKIGYLSAFCGAVSAGAAAGAGIAFLKGGDYKDIAHTIVNALAITSGIICDGAKSSCAAKIAFSVEAGILGYEMYKMGEQFYGGDGVVSKGVEHTIANIGHLGKVGMKETDKEILSIMTCFD